ncbi:MAG: aminotransferase class III-fold pyridoxal phosphate-dependent enzyme, partial [Bifidobacteriaceae bacterium]|nr:aminotransferase class III-fold pyridoxal phosphate-dependent enzyme [Bifidobacteriaceae bacterium]
MSAETLAAAPAQTPAPTAAQAQAEAQDSAPAPASRRHAAKHAVQPGQSELADRYGAALLGVFSPQRVLVRGEGAWVWDADGRRYLDLLAGIAVNALGHAHPDWVRAVADQLATLGHVSNFFASQPQIELAEELLRLAGAGPDARVFFANSGAEAVEAAVKMALRTGRPRLLALSGSFHGRTLGA